MQSHVGTSRAEWNIHGILERTRTCTCMAIRSLMLIPRARIQNRNQIFCDGRHGYFFMTDASCSRTTEWELGHWEARNCVRVESDTGLLLLTLSPFILTCIFHIKYLFHTFCAHFPITVVSKYCLSILFVQKSCTVPE